MIGLAVVLVIRGPEQQGDAPDGSDAHQRVDGTGQPGAGATTDECHQVKVEKADGTPVKPPMMARDKANLSKNT